MTWEAKKNVRNKNRKQIKTGSQTQEKEEEEIEEETLIGIVIKESIEDDAIMGSKEKCQKQK